VKKFIISWGIIISILSVAEGSPLDILKNIPFKKHKSSKSHKSFKKKKKHHSKSSKYKKTKRDKHKGARKK